MCALSLPRIDKNRETALTLKNRNCEFLYLLVLLVFIAHKFFINKKSLENLLLEVVVVVHLLCDGRRYTQATTHLESKDNLQTSVSSTI